MESSTSIPRSVQAILTPRSEPSLSPGPTEKGSSAPRPYELDFDEISTCASERVPDDNDLGANELNSNEYNIGRYIRVAGATTRIAERVLGEMIKLNKRSFL